MEQAYGEALREAGVEYIEPHREAATFTEGIGFLGPKPGSAGSGRPGTGGRPGSAGVVEDVLQGFREVNWENGHVFRGQWKENMMNGKGRLETPEGMYRGQFVDHKMHGFGRYDFASSQVYVGEFADNLFNGQGVMGYSEESAYEGQFVDGKRHGQGTMLYENGDVYEGEWEDGKREGSGLYVAHNKTEIYWGMFRKNHRHGAGELWMHGDPNDRHEEEHQHREFPKWAVEYKDGTLIRKRSRPSSRPKWPEKNPGFSVVHALATEIDDGCKDQPSAMTNFDILEVAGTGSPKTKEVEEVVRIRRHHDDDDDEDDDDDAPHLLKTRSEGISRTASNTSDNDPENAMESPVKMLKARQQSMEWDQVKEEAQKPPLFQDQQHASAEYTGKVDSRLVIKVEKAENLPPIGDDCNPVLQVQSRGMVRTTKEIKNNTDPVWKSTFEFEHSLEEAHRRAVFTVTHHSGAKVGHHHKFLGKLVLDLSSLQLGQYHPSKAFYLKGETGKHTVFGRSEGDGKKPVSMLWISYYLITPPDALLTLRIFSAKELKSFDMRAVGAPFVVAKYMGQEKRTAAGHDAAQPKWNESVNFEVNSETVHRSVKFRQIPRDFHLHVWDSMMLSHDTLMGQCTIDIHDVIFAKNAEAKWHKLTNPETAVTKLGSIHTSVSWGLNEETALRIHIEEGLNITQYLGERSMLPKKVPVIDPFADPDDDEKKEEDDPDRYTTLPDSYLKIWFDSKRSKKTQVWPEDVNPQWNERFSFGCKRSELPSSIVIQCFHKRKSGPDEFIGKVTVDITDLKLDDLALSKWLRLEDPELVAVEKEQQRKLDRAAKKAAHLKAFLAGKLPEGSSADYFEDDEEESREEEDEVDDDMFSPVHGNKLFSRLMGGQAKPSRRDGLLNQIANGKNPAELGRIKLRVMWVSIEDDEDKECIRLWNKQMESHACRRILKRLIKSWSHELMVLHFQKLLRSMAVGRMQWDQAVTRHKEKVMPKVFSAWGEQIQTAKMSGQLRVRNQKDNVLKPFWGLWLEVVEASRKRDRVKGKVRKGSTTSQHEEEDHAAAIMRPKFDISGLLAGDFLTPSKPREVDPKFMKQLGRKGPAKEEPEGSYSPTRGSSGRQVGPGAPTPETPKFLTKQETFSRVAVD